MLLQRISLTALIPLLASVSTPWGLSLPVPSAGVPVLAQTQGAGKAEADRLLQRGGEQLDAGQPSAALQFFQQALTIYREIKDPQGEGQALQKLGNTFLVLGDLPKAIDFYQQTLTVAREIPNRPLELKALYFLGKVYSLQEDYPKAIESYQQSLTVVRELKNPQLEMQVLSELALAYGVLGETAKAIDAYQQKLAIARQLNNRQEEANTLNSLGVVYQNSGNQTKAIEYSQQTLALAQEIPDRWLEGQALGNLGDAYAALGEPEKAIEFYQQSLAVARQLKNSEFKELALQLESINLGRLIVAYQLLGDSAKAMEYIQQELSLALELKDRQREGNALKDMADIYQEIDDYTKAIEYLERSLAIAREIDDVLLESQCLESLGVNYFSVGEFDRALEYSQHNLATVRSFNSSHPLEQAVSGQERKKRNYFRQQEVSALLELGNAYLFGAGEYSKGLDYFQQSLKLAQQLNFAGREALALESLGTAYMTVGDYRQAIQHYEQYLERMRQDKRPQFESLNRQIEGIGMRFLARAYAGLGERDKAIELAQQSLAIAQESESVYNKATALGELGYVLFLTGNLPEAEKAMREAINGFESVRSALGEKDAYKVSIFDIQAETYRLLQQVLVAQNKTSEALEIAERGRARAFVELLAKQLTGKPDVSVAAQQEQQPVIKPPNLQEIQEIARDKKATLVEYSIAYDPAQFILPGQFRGIKQNAESELYIWVVKPTGEIALRKVDLTADKLQNTALANLIANSRQSMDVRGRGGVVVEPDETSQAQSLQQLHKLLIEPIADLLPAEPGDPVIFVPQASLFLVPFPALQDATGKYRIEKHTILTAPAIQILDLTRKQRNLVERRFSVLQNLVVGNPTMPSVPPAPGEPAQQLVSLPGAEKEAQAIAPLLKTVALIGNRATKAAILPLLSKARIIHFATHGLLDDIRGIGSAIALAPSPNDSGLLTAEEILKLPEQGSPLSAELVVLSACDTGRGRITGDGIVGLSRSLITAGVPSVIVSLWSVSDDSTAFLMAEFYKNLQQNLDKASALRQAMLETKKRYSNPAQWAAFTLIGEAR
jgi:CHAT domain-containing protein/tetratricopeptide (TPR) repeat protein